MISSSIAVPDQNNSVSVSSSKTIGLSFFNSNSKEHSFSNLSDYFYFEIPRYNQIPSFKQFFTSNYTTSSRNLLILDGFIISSRNVSIHYQLKPSATSLSIIGYFVALKFGSNPYLNSTIQLFDMFQIFCPINLTTENSQSFYTFFANMSKTINFTGFVGIGIKQLTSNEFTNYCINQKNLYAINNIDNQTKVNFTGNISVRIYLSGCYYIDKLTGMYSSYGMEVLSTSNTTYTQCRSNHLTEFASGWIVVPNAINFDDVWANASFTQNMSIYITVIVLSTLYFIILIWVQFKDRKDMIKSEIKSFSSNKKYDSYFYEVTLNNLIPFNCKMQFLGTVNYSRIVEIDRKSGNNLRFILSSKKYTLFFKIRS
jgi:hypothetical protein